MSSLVSTMESPGFSSTGSSLSVPMRIFGPERSAMMASRLPVAWEAARRSPITWRWLSKEPWEKLSRATFIPAISISSMTFRLEEAGPMVQMIFVLWSGRFTKHLLILWLRHYHCRGIIP